LHAIFGYPKASKSRIFSVPFLREQAFKGGVNEGEH
jgi:hypothetical protein